MKGKGFWKFNNSLLKDKTYVDIVKNLINQIKHQYSCYVYNRDKIPSIENENLSFIISYQLFLGILLMEIRGKSISYSTYKKKKQKEREISLEKEIADIEQNLTHDKENILSKKQKELQDIFLEHIFRSQFVRSKAIWIDEGEKPSNYFLSLE